jgi:AcrR family transcriptional regulator
MMMHAPQSKAPRSRRSQEERSAASRARLIESAIRCMRERGLAATNLIEIAASANLTRGAIQHHFNSRAELILAAVRELDERISRSFDEHSVPAGITGVERVATLFDDVVALTASEDTVAVFDLWSASRGDPELKTRVLELQRPLTDQFRELWRRNLEGHLSSTLIDASFGIVLMMTQGIAMAQLLKQPPDIVDQMVVDTREMLLEHIKTQHDLERGRAFLR